MEFSFDFKQFNSSPSADPHHETDISIWDANQLLILQKKNSAHFSDICTVLDKVGKASSEAQGLKHVITSALKMLNSAYKLFLFAHGNKAFGILKIGRKKLFYSVCKLLHFQCKAFDCFCRLKLESTKKLHLFVSWISICMSLYNAQVLARKYLNSCSSMRM